MPNVLITKNHHSLNVLLDKANAILTANKKSLDYIKSRRGEKVAMRYEYTVQANPADTSNSTESLLTLKCRTSSRDVDDILSNWRYQGLSLIRETLVTDSFINVKLNRFEDLLRIHYEYDKLLGKYPELLNDTSESRSAVEGLLRNLEILQKTTNEIQDMMLDVDDRSKVDDEIRAFSNLLSKELKALQKRVSGVSINLKGCICDEVKVKEKPSIKLHETNKQFVKFSDFGALTCTKTLSEGRDEIMAVEPYLVNGKQHIACVTNGVIKIWDLVEDTCIATLCSGQSKVNVLTSYEKCEKPFLVSGSDGGDIKIWNLSDNTYSRAILSHKKPIKALQMFYNDGKQFLASGDKNGIINVWDLENFRSNIQSLRQTDPIGELTVYYINDNPFLASTSKKKVNIWSLKSKDRVIKISSHALITSLSSYEYNGKTTLVFGDYGGSVHLWDCHDNKLISTFKAYENFESSVSFLKVIRNENKLCLVTCANMKKSIKLWNLKNESLVSALRNDEHIFSTEVFMNGDKPCLVTGDRKGNMRLWMK